MKSTLLIGADLVPTKSNQEFFEGGSIECIVDAKLLNVLAEADYRIFNLEVPLTDQRTPIWKCGVNLMASRASINGIKQLGVDFFTLANNHILDQGEQGLFSTVELLQNSKIAFSGVGNTLAEACKPHTICLGGKKIGIYCCAEHEFSIATDNSAGANPFDPLESLDHIVELKDKCDYVICLYHGGKEHYRYPSPYLQQVCRKIVSKGADLVVCQHTHCVGCKEDYANGTIVYGQGNFLFDHQDNEFWQTSILISVDIVSGSLEFIPLRKAGKGVMLAKGADAKQIIDGFHARSREILGEGFIETKYRKYAASMIANNITSLDALYNNFVFRAINK